ncbi:serine protease [Mobilitalea sibirica]|uniref:Serine protease n=1 Tax=Mobilitalea sibirica TaxID=1462919 RepID=A0A8J7HB60_9FIRM|nr:NfeD family protein [Mobilitalea sibirica]MBH1939637.1 serine protease [Mobilitalea sibirica]
MFGQLDATFIIAVILLIAGFILVGIEMVVPGFSFPGISGIICLIIGIFLVSDTFVEGAVMTIVVLAILGLMLAIIVGLLSKGKIKSPIILKEDQKKDKGFISSSDLNYLLGKEGFATSDLRPSGSGNFDGIELDVISEGKYITKGTQLIIHKVQGSKLIVKVREQ